MPSLKITWQLNIEGWKMSCFLLRKLRARCHVQFHGVWIAVIGIHPNDMEKLDSQGNCCLWRIN